MSFPCLASRMWSQVHSLCVTVLVQHQYCHRKGTAAHKKGRPPTQPCPPHTKTQHSLTLPCSSGSQLSPMLHFQLTMMPLSRPATTRAAAAAGKPPDRPNHSSVAVLAPEPSTITGWWGEGGGGNGRAAAVYADECFDTGCSSQQQTVTSSCMTASSILSLCQHSTGLPAASPCAQSVC
jgi:hypothetical protein